MSARRCILVVGMFLFLGSAFGLSMLCGVSGAFLIGTETYVLPECKRATYDISFCATLIGTICAVLLHQEL